MLKPPILSLNDKRFAPFQSDFIFLCKPTDGSKKKSWFAWNLIPRDWRPIKVTKVASGLTPSEMAILLNNKTSVSFKLIILDVYGNRQHVIKFTCKMVDRWQHATELAAEKGITAKERLVLMRFNGLKWTGLERRKN